MFLIYRISDISNDSPRIIRNKLFCLNNCIHTFHKEVKDGRILVIADNCKKHTVDYIKGLNVSYKLTSLGNAGSLLFSIKTAIDRLWSGETVYFIEDDYIHHPKSSDFIKEGIAISDYVSLLDHPDKYSDFYHFGEATRVFRTKSRHWKLTVSSCMTFATKVHTLEEDYQIWEKYTKGKNVPQDHLIYLDLSKEKGRKLINCIPGAAITTDYCGMLGRCYIFERWAIRLIEDSIEREIRELIKDRNPELESEFNALVKDVCDEKKIARMSAFYGYHFENKEKKS